MDSSQNIYTQTPSQVFIKNFLAGFARGLGNIFVYLLTLVLIYNLVIKPQLGQITEFFNLYKQSMEMFKNQSQPTQKPSLDIQDLLNQLQLTN